MYCFGCLCFIICTYNNGLVISLGNETGLSDYTIGFLLFPLGACALQKRDNHSLPLMTALQRYTEEGWLTTYKSYKLHLHLQ